jgi:hypothetical protein
MMAGYGRQDKNRIFVGDQLEGVHLTRESWLRDAQSRRCSMETALFDHG